MSYPTAGSPVTWKRLPDVTKAQDAEFKRFRKKTRFLVDESLGRGVAKLLRNLGWNVVFGHDVLPGGSAQCDIARLTGTLRLRAA
jgi:hypothetical protein